MADIRESRLARRESVEQRRNYEMGLMDKERTEYSTKVEVIEEYLLGEPSQVHLTGGRVRGKYWMIMEWYRSGNEVVTRKKAER